MKILNLTQHQATPEQKQDGVVDWAEARNMLLEAEAETNGDPTHWATVLPESLSNMLTFEYVQDSLQAAWRAKELAGWCELLGFKAAMVGGAPFFMPALVQALTERGITPLFAFSKRESVEQVQPDGSTRKVAVFRHEGFIRAYDDGSCQPF